MVSLAGANRGNFFPPYVPRGPWAPQSLSDESWERTQSVGCALWCLRAEGVRIAPAKLLHTAAARGRLLLDLHPTDGLPSPVAIFRADRGGARTQLLGARIVKETPAFVQLAGWQWNRAETARVRQTWFAAVDTEAGRSVLAKLASAASFGG